MRCFSKRLLLVLFSVVIAFFGISVTDTAPNAAYLKEYKSKSGYRSLSTAQQGCYRSMYAVLTDTFDTDGTVNYNENTKACGVQVKFPITLYSMDEVQTLFTMFLRDNPQFFYVDRRYTVQHYDLWGTTAYTHISLMYTMNAEERQRARDKLEDAVQEIIRDIPDTKDEYTKELRVHDALLKRCQFDDKTADADKLTDDQHAYSAYGALVQGRAVCDGYARAMQLLLSRVGIKNSLISGKSVKTGEGHIWNLVSINGKQYHLDATWNDVGELPQHVYFNCSTAMLEKTHRIDERYNGVQCVDIQDNYYIRGNLYLTTDNHDDIVNIIDDQIKNYSKSVEIRFSTNAYEGAKQFLQDAALTRELVNLKLYFTDFILWPYTLYTYEETYVLCMQSQYIY